MIQIDPHTAFNALLKTTTLAAQPLIVSVHGTFLIVITGEMPTILHASLNEPLKFHLFA